LKIGSVFGPIDVFDTEKENSELIASYKAHVTNGSVLQLKYLDFCRAKYGDQSVTVDQNEGLSMEERQVNSVSNFGQSRLSPAMFQFLKKNNLLATNEKDVSYKYIKHGSIGRSISAKQKDSEVIIILDGGVRVVFGNKISHANGHNSSNEKVVANIRCAHAGEKSAYFKVPCNYVHLYLNFILTYLIHSI
jgi:hypothetical protein